MNEQRSEADQVIDGYKLLNCMVTGQNSQVWEVVETHSARHFAMKILLPEKAKDSAARHELFHEAEVGIQLRYPNVIKITHVSKDKNKEPYFVMEYFPAGSMRSRLIYKQYAFIKEHARKIFKQAATALAYMNASGWAHRDVKPDNMLVNATGDLRMIDFAITKKIQPRPFWKRMLKIKEPIQGTRSYMPPEQIRGEAVDARSDIYAFGATMYDLLAYRPPFRGADNQALLEKHLIEKPAPPTLYNPEISDEFSKLILKCLEKKPEKRPQTFHEVLRTMSDIRIYRTDRLGTIEAKPTYRNPSR